MEYELTLKALDVSKPQAEIDHPKSLAVGKAAGAIAQRSENRKATDVEIVQYKERDVVGRA